MDLVTGDATRDPVELGYPANGVLALQTNASPMLAIGQHVSVLSKKTIDNGLHLFNLLNNKELTLVDGRDKLMQSNYSGFNGAPLFDKNSGDMIVSGENGLLYTMETNGDFDHILGTLTISPSYQRYSWLASGQKAKATNVDGSVAMYGSYVYFADQTGILQCVDINSLTPLWAVDTGDNTDATVALDMEDDSTVALYTGNTILSQGRKGVCTIRRYDALTGAQAWAYEVPDLAYTTAAEVGCYASPVVGQNAVSDLVFFTVTNGESGATVYALEKDTGAVRWSQALETPTVSSPVAVYNLEGDAWLVQAESDGKLHLMNAETGKIVNTLQLEGEVEASPAVYRDVLVIATMGADQSYVYGIKLE
jgi:outer membrane protein assembly factor BamB